MIPLYFRRRRSSSLFRSRSSSSVGLSGSACEGCEVDCEPEVVGRSSEALGRFFA
jgi:hypothetical protein